MLYFWDTPINWWLIVELKFSALNYMFSKFGSTNDHLRLYLSFWSLNQRWILLLCYGGMTYFITILVCVFVQHIWACMNVGCRAVSLFALLCFRPFSPTTSLCSACHNKIILPSPIRWRHLSSIIICESWLRNSQQEATGVGAGWARG